MATGLESTSSRHKAILTFNWSQFYSDDRKKLKLFKELRGPANLRFKLSNNSQILYLNVCLKGQLVILIQHTFCVKKTTTKITYCPFKSTRYTYQCISLVL